MIDSKFAYIKKKETFESLISSIPEGLNPIVFIEDTKEMWTCGTYFSIGFPGIDVSETSGSVKVEIGNSFFWMSTTGDSINVKKGDGNRIIINSNALNKIDTEAPLEWDAANKKLLHKDSGVVSGSYGQSTNLGNASVFIVPNITIDKTGHIISAENHNIEIRDYVEQLAPSTSMSDRNILLSYNEANNASDTSQVRKANGLTFNDSTQKLNIAGGIVSNGQIQINHGDLTVTDGYIVGNLKGDVQGSATPKIHLSAKPEYGGASTKLFGHVLLQDILNSEPNPSSTNENVNDTNITASIAASPLMVWNAIQTAKDYADSILGSNNAMLYKGVIEAGTSSPGTFTSSADVGNTYVVTFGDGAYTDSIGYVNGEPVEIGDLLICKEPVQASNSTNYLTIKDKWTIVQTNTTGVVSGPSRATIGQLAVFDSSTGKLIKGLTNGSVGQILTISNSGIPKWENETVQTWRPINYQNYGQPVISALTNSKDSGDLTFGASGNLRLDWDEKTNTLSFYGLSDNTWRNILAYTPTSTTPNTIGENSDLVFSSDFLLIDGEIVTGWASVDIDGNITYLR